MFSAAFNVLVNSALMMLRSGGQNGSFPRPLKAEEEKMWLERSAAGDIEARNKLVEHNLRLVAHIIKKGYPSRKLFLAG